MGPRFARREISPWLRFGPSEEASLYPGNP
jgi:hypothetical protein